MPGLGRIQSPPDPRDHQLRLYVRSLASSVIPALPRYVYPRFWRPSVLDQGMTSQCVAYSGALMRSVAEWGDKRRRIDFDAPPFYARCKATDGIPHIEGTYIRAAAELMRSEGMRVALSPFPAEVGNMRTIASYAALNTVAEIKSAIWLYGSAWLGTAWYSGWYDIHPGRLMPITQPDLGTEDGGHAFTAIGYSDHRQSFRIQNSWGMDWGHNGRAWLPYAALDIPGIGWEGWLTIDTKGDQ